MQISMKCSIAVHCLIFIYEAKDIVKVTSELLSESTGVNAVIIRKILGMLKKAGIIEIIRGTGGVQLLYDIKDINLYMIYNAVEQGGLSSLIGIHKCSDRKCPVAKSISYVLSSPYSRIEEAVKKTMESISLKSMIDDYHKYSSVGK